MTTKTYEVQLEEGVTDVHLKLLPVPAPAPVQPPPSPPPVEPPHLKGELGIDVSRHQGVIDWDKIAAVPIGYAGIRATMGITGKDDQFKRNWTEAKKEKIQRLPYHYFVNNILALPQLENFLSFVGNDLGELPMVLDVEPTSGQVIDNKQANTDAIRVWLTECEAKTGKRPVIYASAWSLGRCTTYDIAPMSWLKEYKLWLPAYTTASSPSIPKPWTKYFIWQYSSTGKLPGIDGNVDLNRFGEY